MSVAAHRVEEAIKRGKSQAGLADYEVRNWRGWHHHQILSLMATWFLTLEAHRGKKNNTGNHRPTNPRRDRNATAHRLQLRHSDHNSQKQNTQVETKRTSPLLPLQKT